MATTLKFGSGQWATKVGSTLAYNDENGNFKPLPFNFTRSTSATRVNKDGLIEVVTNNKPRIDFLNDSNGALLLEPARTNLVTNSNDFTSWINSGSYITAEYGISPDGSQNASRCLFTNTNQTLSKIIGTNGTLSYSIYVKGVNGETINISMASGSDNSFTLNGEWQRLSYSDTVTNSTLNINTFGGKTARDLLIFGAQLEQGSYPTSYIPTQGAISTKVAETCNGAGNSQIFNDSEGVLYTEISALANDLTYRSISISGHINLFYNNVSNTIVVSSTGGALIIRQLSDITSFNKIALKYKENDFALWVNGVELGTDTSASTSNILTTLNYDNGAGGSKWYGSTKQIQYFNTALTDLQLQQLTTL